MSQNHSQLSAKMLICNYIVRDLLNKISEIEEDTEATITEKISKMKKIRDEITKVGTEIDNLKKEINLLNTYRVN